MNQTASPFSSSSDSAFALRFTFPGLPCTCRLFSLIFLLLFVLYHTPGSRVRVRLLRDFTTRPSSVAIAVVVTTDLTVCIFSFLGISLRVVLLLSRGKKKLCWKKQKTDKIKIISFCVRHGFGPPLQADSNSNHKVSPPRNTIHSLH